LAEKEESDDRLFLLLHALCLERVVDCLTAPLCLCFLGKPDDAILFCFAWWGTEEFVERVDVVWVSSWEGHVDVVVVAG